MEKSEKECFKTSPCKEMDDEDESEAKDGGSSSNSTVEEGEKKLPVRSYLRSKMPRLRWTPELHLRFAHAVERLGGPDRATPKLVLQVMGIKGMKIGHVKSHLQMYRSKKIEESNQLGLKDQRLFMEGVNQNIFNLSHLPLLPNFNHQRLNSNPRYGDPTWNEKWMQDLSITRILSRQYSNLHHLSSRIFPSSNEGMTWRADKNSTEYKPLHKQEPWLGQSRQNPNEIDSLKLQIHQETHEERSNPRNLSQERERGLKRKPLLDGEIDLNLSLQLEARSGYGDDERLGLSLYTIPEASEGRMKKRKEDLGDEEEREGSTLDLTL